MQQQQQQQQSFGFIRDPYHATEVQFQQFVRGVDAVLNQWTALHLVAQHCDALALQSMYQELISWFQTEGEVYSDDLEIFFENFFTEARSVVIEDDSMKEVGDVLHEMYCRCCKNDFSLVEHYLGTWEVYRKINPVRLSVNAGGDDDQNGAEEEEQGVDGKINNQITNEGQQMMGAEEEEEEQGNGLNAQTLVTQQKPRNKKNKKNAYERDNDGWCVVQR